MPVAVTDYVNVEERAAQIGATLPDGIVILPANFETVSPEDDFRYPSEALTTKKILRRAGVVIAQLSRTSSDIGFVHNRSAEWALPIIFFSAELMKQSPDMWSLAMSTVQDFVKDSLKSVIGGEKIKFDVVIEDRDRSRCRKVSYEGSADGISQMRDVVEALVQE